VIDLLLLTILGFALVLASGCSSPMSPAASPVSGDAPRIESGLTVRADWDDVDASVEVGAGQAEAVMVGAAVVSSDGLRREYALAHISGLRGTLIATRAAQGPDPTTIRLTCRMGEIPTPGVQTRILERVRARLEDLRGREFVPIRE
jgi:hypothetical protein